MAVNERAWHEAEAAVIGSLAIDAECAGEVFRLGRSAYFRTDSLRHIFEAALSLWTRGKPIDAVTLLHAAGDEYETTIRQCMALTPTAANVGKYLEILRNEYRLSRITEEAAQLLGARSEEDAIEVFERIGTLLRDTDTIEDVGLAEMFQDYIRRMKRKPNYLKWGIPQLDSALFVESGDFLVLAGESSSGKTALALQFAMAMALSGKRVLFFSLETTKEKLEDRLAAERQMIGIPTFKSKLRSLSDRDFSRAESVAESAEQFFFRVIRNADTLEKISNRIIMHRADVVFIDYLQIIRRNGPNRFEKVTEISMELHRIASRLGCTIVALSQVTKPEGDKEVTVDDLRESGQIRNDAEVVLILLNANKKGTRKELVIAKDKDGQTNRRLLLEFEPAMMTFSYRRKIDEPAPEPEGEDGELPD